ncbi:Clp protease ClpP [Phytohabitans sp. ZYX-F-186]|uniref:ATP-dependent Clp protease proteolytic subunit n=1 Tax=Phytohabitans maris TaxID=3071409 RepID=A0ABU0ZVN0_9ACTN|nr:head maturation protease, ClpP-related [Phytohabitans sp. ZYX-F-186]MDQ7910250.1 Clp protease ClpP [Phytohabitans sp. ZYX-F-186]
MTVDLAKLVNLATQVEERVSAARPTDGGKSWYRITNAAKKNEPVEVFIYDRIGGWGVSARDFVMELRGVKAQKIMLHINSPGGEVFDGVAIHAALVNHPAHVVAIVDGLAASAASFIAMAGDEIEVEKAGRLMIHDASGGCLGNAKDMREMADLLDSLSQTIAEIYADRAGGTVEEWREAMLAETWFTAAEAVEKGLADRVAGDDSDEPDNKLTAPLAASAEDDQTGGPTLAADLVEDTVSLVDPEWFAEMMKGAFHS